MFNGVGIAIFSGWNGFLYSLITWICYLFGIHKKAFSFNQGAGLLFIPFALMVSFFIGALYLLLSNKQKLRLFLLLIFQDFLVSLFFMLFFGISTLVCAICIFEGLKYRFGVFLTYLFATGFSLISGLAYGYYAILIYRACPNGQLRNLSSLVIDGDGTSARPTMESNVPTSASRPTMVV